MRKSTLIVLFSLLLFSACKKESIPVTTYYLSNDVTKQISSVPYLDGTMYEVVVYCYKGNDIIRQDNIDPIAPDGEISKKIEVPAEVEKIRVSFKFLPPESSSYSLTSNYRRYVVTSYLLKAGVDNKASLNDDTMLSNTISSAFDKKVLSKQIETFYK